MGNPDLCIHAGAPKTATSFLQNVVFRRVQSAKCLPTPSVEIMGQSVRFGDLFDFSPAFWKNIREDPFSEGNQSPEKTVVISDERVFGGLVSPKPWIPGPVAGSGLREPIKLFTQSRPDPHTVASHIRELKKVASDWGYDRVRFLLTIRRQDTKLASSYAQISDRVRGAGQQNFERWVRHILHDVVGYNKGGGIKLDYSIWWNEVARVIGKENVLFLAFEDLQRSQSEFLRRWLRFAGVEETNSIAESFSGSGEGRENVRSLSKSEWVVREPIRRGPNLRPRRLFKPLGLPKKLPLRRPDFRREEKVKLTEELTEEILDVYKSGNRVLHERNNHLDLKRYGYY